jgi:hypothetical protein
MTEAEFNKGMQELIAEFSQSAYSQKKGEIFWRHLKSLEAQLFHEAVTHFIANSPKNQPPLLEKILAFMADARARRRKDGLNLPDLPPVSECVSPERVREFIKGFSMKRIG